MARRVIAKDKWKSKSWFSLVSPPEFGEKEIGETPSSDSAGVVGRRMEVAANEITSGQKLNHVKLFFEVEKIVGNSAKTKLAGYEVSRSYIRSIVRRRRNRVDLVKDFELKNKKIRVKAIIMTVGNCYAKQEKAIRKTMDEIITKSLHNKTIEEVIASVLKREIQNSIKANSKKIFPVSIVEIRKIEFLN